MVYETELKRAVAQRYKRIDIDRFKAELKDHVTHYLFEHTGRSPIVIPVVNIIGSKSENHGKDVKTKTAQEVAAEQQRRFQEMRSRLLSQDAGTD